MYHLLIVILDDLHVLPDLLKAWREAGVPGVTILQSAGGYRTETWLARMGLGALERLFEAEEVRRRTVLALVDDEEVLARAIAEAERVVGGFDRPHSGLLMVLPVSQALGLKKRPPEARPLLEPALRPEWAMRRDTPVGEAAAILHLEPTLVPADLPLDQVALAMLKRPHVQVACVVSEDGRLIGVLSLQDLADDLFFHILPEEFLSEVRDLKQVVEFADRSRTRTAADAMKEPVWVRQSETVKEAFKRMHEHRLTGLPIVDDRYHVVGYVNLLELLVSCLECLGGPAPERAEGMP